MTISGKIKGINDKMEKNKAQYDWDRETAKAFALSSENLSKYKLLTGTEVLPEEYLLEKPGALKRF